MPAFWNASNIFHLAGIRQSRILRHRRLERFAADSLQRLSRDAVRRAHIPTSFDTMAPRSRSAKIDGPLAVVRDRSIRFASIAARLKGGLAVFCIVGLLPLSARAQITEPLLLLPRAAAPTAPRLPSPPGEQPTYAGQTVMERARPEFDPIGLRVGDFFWFPRGELDESYNSNIFATTKKPIYDLITTLQPAFDLLSIFPRNSLNFHGNSVVQVYADHPAQNTQDGYLSVDGSLDVTAGSSFYGTAQVAHQNIAYGSPSSPVGAPNAFGSIAQPVTYWDYLARAGYQQGLRRFSYQIDVGSESVQYNAVPLIGGGVLPQSSSDATVSEAAVRASYELIPDYLGYVRASGSLYNYWRTTPGGVRPNSKLYRADVGLQILPRHIIYGDVYVGYLIQNFASGLGSTSSPDYGGRLVWNVTPLSTLTFTGVRTAITGTPSNGGTTVAMAGTAGNGYLASIVTANGDHELLRNLLVNVNASYENDSFQGTSRTDNVFTAGAGLRYLVNRYLFLGGTFAYQQRSSSLAGASFTQNIVMLRLGTQF
jgi:hypothetical protein